MYRHAIVLESPSWIAASSLAGPPRSEWPEDAWVRVRHASGHHGRFRAALTGKVLELAAEVTVPAGWDAARTPAHPEWYLRDHVLFFLDPGHDHLSRRLISVGRDGHVQLEDLCHFMGEELSDVQTAKLDVKPLQPRVEVSAIRAGWRVRICIPRAELGLADGGPEHGVPLGIHARLCCAGAVMLPPACFPDAPPLWSTNPFAFADLLPADAPLAIERLDFGKPVWRTADVTSAIAIEGRLGAGAPRAGICRVSVTHADGSTVDSSEHRWRATGRSLRLRVPVDYPFTSKWTTHVLAQTAHVDLTFLDPDGRRLWQGGYPFGFDGGILVRDPYGSIPDRAPWNRRPDPERSDFVDAYRAWLLSKLPAWQPRTTRQGAPSDFFLKARRREDDLDLMRPSVMRDIARLIRRKFPDWQDGLCAAALLLHHPCLTVHSSNWARIASAADSPTILRLGGCFCSETARVAAELADLLGSVYRVPLRGFVLGLRGHLSGLVETPIGDVLIDPMLGIYYHTLDNRRLATLDEMRADARITRRMWTRPWAHGHEFFLGVANQVKAPRPSTAITYPR